MSKLRYWRNRLLLIKLTAADQLRPEIMDIKQLNEKNYRALIFLNPSAVRAFEHAIVRALIISFFDIPGRSLHT